MNIENLKTKNTKTIEINGMRRIYDKNGRDILFDQMIANNIEQLIENEDQYSSVINNEILVDNKLIPLINLKPKKIIIDSELKNYLLGVEAFINGLESKVDDFPITSKNIESALYKYVAELPLGNQTTDTHITRVNDKRLEVKEKLVLEFCKNTERTRTQFLHISELYKLDDLEEKIVQQLCNRKVSIDEVKRMLKAHYKHISDNFNKCGYFTESTEAYEAQFILKFIHGSIKKLCITKSKKKNSEYIYISESKFKSEISNIETKYIDYLRNELINFGKMVYYDSKFDNSLIKEIIKIQDEFRERIAHGQAETFINLSSEVAMDLSDYNEFHKQVSKKTTHKLSIKLNENDTKYMYFLKDYLFHSKPFTHLLDQDINTTISKVCNTTANIKRKYILNYIYSNNMHTIVKDSNGELYYKDLLSALTYNGKKGNHIPNVDKIEYFVYTESDSSSTRTVLRKYYKLLYSNVYSGVIETKNKLLNKPTTLTNDEKFVYGIIEKYGLLDFKHVIRKNKSVKITDERINEIFLELVTRDFQQFINNKKYISKLNTYSNDQSNEANEIITWISEQTKIDISNCVYTPGQFAVLDALLISSLFYSDKLQSNLIQALVRLKTSLLRLEEQYRNIDEIDINSILKKVNKQSIGNSHIDIKNNYFNEYIDGINNLIALETTLNKEKSTNELLVPLSSVKEIFEEYTNSEYVDEYREFFSMVGYKTDPCFVDNTLRYFSLPSKLYIRNCHKQYMRKSCARDFIDAFNYLKKDIKDIDFSEVPKLVGANANIQIIQNYILYGYYDGNWNNISDALISDNASATQSERIELMRCKQLFSFIKKYKSFGILSDSEFILNVVNELLASRILKNERNTQYVESFLRKNNLDMKLSKELQMNKQYATREYTTFSSEGSGILTQILEDNSVFTDVEKLELIKEVSKSLKRFGLNISFNTEINVKTELKKRENLPQLSDSEIKYYRNILV